MNLHGHISITRSPQFAVRFTLGVWERYLVMHTSGSGLWLINLDMLSKLELATDYRGLQLRSPAKAYLSGEHDGGLVSFRDTEDWQPPLYSFSHGSKTNTEPHKQHREFCQ